MIIGIVGKKGSGKDEVGAIIQYLTSSYADELEYWQYKAENKSSYTDSRFCIKKFAEPLKQATSILLGCTRKDLEDRDFKYQILYSAHDPQVAKFKNMTTRLFLQLLGTEVGRNIIDENVWVDLLLKDYKHLQDNFIITDVRYKNELDAINKYGFNIKINRVTIENADTHASETELDTLKTDYIINNNGYIEELIEKVKTILEKERII